MNSVRAVSNVVIKELYRRKDFYVLFVLTAVITLLLGSINIFNDNRIVRYLKEICLLLIWISSLVIAISTAARQIPYEREQRTIFPLLAKPITRWQFVLGKFLGCWLATGIALLVFYFFFVVISGSREHYWPLVAYFQAATLHWCLLAILVAAALLGSLVFAAPSSNGTICFIVASGILLLGRHLNTVALGLPQPASTLLYGLYYVIPHLEFYDMRDLIIHDWPPVAWWVWGLAVLYAFAYTMFFLVATWVLFRKKPLNER